MINQYTLITRRNTLCNSITVIWRFMIQIGLTHLTVSHFIHSTFEAEKVEGT